MNILINASNLSGGGGVQVANSICMSLNTFTRHHFVVVGSVAMDKTLNAIESYPDVEIFHYNYPPRDWKSLITGRNDVLDCLVKNKEINCVLTVFGPMKWVPRCKHVQGFGLSHLVMPESPYFQRMGWKQSLKAKFSNAFNGFIFKRSSKIFYTENPMITERVKKLFNIKDVYTITNYYNQVFDEPNHWQEHKLPPFDGKQFLIVSTMGPHKNIPIIIDVAKILRMTHPKFKFRFVVTVREDEMPTIPVELKKYFFFIGQVDIAECPPLYEQCDYSFQPTLLECFTATYPEAMRMKRPIITTDLEFAHGLCGSAAIYYDPLNAKDAADKIYELVKNPAHADSLVKNGEKQLKLFDSYKDRASKIVELCEKTI